MTVGLVYDKVAIICHIIRFTMKPIMIIMDFDGRLDYESNKLNLGVEKFLPSSF